jgi:hypothetical protein
MLYKQDLDKVKQWTAEHSKYCWELWEVELSYDHFDPEVKTFYVREDQENTLKPVEFKHVRELEERIQSEFGDRYKVGILFEQKPSE